MGKLPVIGFLDQPVTFRYEDVLEKGKPYHDGDYFSIRHPHMDCGKRAKIFAPFAALKGFEEEVQSKEVKYERKHELDPEELRDLNAKLNRIHSLTGNGRLAKKNRVLAEVEYFVLCEDEHNEAYHRLGQYVRICDLAWSADRNTQRLRIGEAEIPFAMIRRIHLKEQESNGRIV